MGRERTLCYNREKLHIPKFVTGHRAAFSW